MSPEDCILHGRSPFDFILIVVEDEASIVSRGALNPGVKHSKSLE